MAPIICRLAAEPRALISVIGGITDGDLAQMPVHEEREFHRGLALAAVATRAWVLTGGTRCAGAGLDRSLVVTFACAALAHADAELSKVSEASMCVYDVTVRTPAACE